MCNNYQVYYVPLWEGSSFKETKAKPLSSSPFLLYNLGQQILLMQNCQEEFMELSIHGEDVFTRAVISLIRIYYIFHLEYPVVAKRAYFFLQEHVLHDFLTKRSLCYARYKMGQKMAFNYG